MVKLLFTFLFLSLATPACAITASYTVNKEKSNIKFTAVQNDAPIEGEFKDYTAQIDFSPSDLANSKAAVEVKTESLTATYDQLVETVKAPDWLDVKSFSSAKFVTTKFIKLAGNEYEADGTLTIRKQSRPLKFKFSLVMQGNTDTVDGAFIIKRTDFGVGQGKWKATSAVKDEVKISVHLVTTAKP